MVTTIQGIDPDLRAVLDRVVSRFFRLRKGTRVDRTRKSLLEKRHALTDLVSADYLRTVGSDYIPTFKLISEIDPDISRVGTTEVNVVLCALRNLYIQHDGRNEFSLAEIVEAVKTLAPGLDENDAVPGLFLAIDFGFFASWSWPTNPEGLLTFATVGVTESILDFRSAQETWQKITASRSDPGRVIAQTGYEFPLEPKPELLAVDFSFVSDTKLRQIIDRDYSDLQGTAPSAIKSRIILAGGLIEALLLDGLITRSADALSAKRAERDARSGTAKPLDEWHLSSLIDVATEIGILSEDASRHSATIRQYRNLVHPGLERRAPIAVRERVANIGEQVLWMVIEDLQP